MKKAIKALVAIGVIVGVVLVGWELVAKPGPLRKAWWRYKMYRNPVYEARLQMNLRQAITDEDLARENQTLDGGAVLLPVVRELGLVEVWQVDGEWAAVERLAANSGLRRGDSELVLILAVRDSEQEVAGKIIQPLGKSFFEEKQKVGQGSGAGSVPAGTGP